MSSVRRFSSFLDFQAFLWELEDAHLRETSWARDERNDWYVWVPEDAVVGEDRVSGSIATEREAAKLTPIPATKAFFRIPLQTVHWPSVIPGSAGISVTTRIGDGNLMESLIDELSRLPDLDVSVETWECDPYGSMPFFVLTPRVGGVPMPRFDVPDIDVLQELPGTSGFRIPLGLSHPLGAFASRLFPPANAQQARLIFGSYQRWLVASRVRGPSPLCGTIDLDHLEARLERPARAQRVTLEARVPLEFVPSIDDERRYHVAERIYLFEQTRGALPGTLLDLMDVAQARLADLEYVCVPVDQETESPYRGAYHYVVVHEPGEVDPGLTADATFELPDSFRRHRMRVFVQQGYRFRPFLEQLLDRARLPKTWLEELRKRVGCEDPEATVLVSEGRTPFSPQILELPRGRSLAESIAVVFENWHVEPEALVQRQGRHDVEARIDELYAAIEGGARETEEALEKAATNHFSEIDGIVRATTAALDRARADLKGLDETAAAVSACLAQASASWDALVREVGTRHAALLEGRAQWSAGVAADVSEEMRRGESFADGVRNAETQAGQSLVRLATLKKELDRLSSRCNQLQTSAEQSAAEMRGKIATEEGRVEQALAAASERVGEVQRAFRHLEERKAALQVQIEATRADYQRLAGELATAEQQLEERSRALAALQSTQRELKRTERELEARIREQERQRELLPELEGQVAELRLQNARLEPYAAEYAERAAEVEQRQQENKRLEKRIDEHRQIAERHEEVVRAHEALQKGEAEERERKIRARLRLAAVERHRRPSVWQRFKRFFGR